MSVSPLERLNRLAPRLMRVEGACGDMISLYRAFQFEGGQTIARLERFFRIGNIAHGVAHAVFADRDTSDQKRGERLQRWWTVIDIAARRVIDGGGVVGKAEAHTVLALRDTMRAPLLHTLSVLSLGGEWAGGGAGV